jgi:hemoglobin/transferrin/lactoferrin receptor protein
MMLLRVLVTTGVFVGMLAADVRAQNPAQFEGRLVREGTGAPVSRATVTIVGMSGAIRSDSDGRFAWAPAPRLPFHVVVVLESGQLTHPIIVDAFHPSVMPLYVKEMTSEALTVLGSAPSISAAPAAAKSVLASLQLSSRNPENLVQALETIPGVGQVSEGHGAVPAVRGLARGRTLLLIDGARVTAERRVGPSVTFVDPSALAGIDVARGPGSVAYGSDALGGVISVRTRRAEPGTPLRFRASGTLGGGVPEARGSVDVAKGFQRGGVFVQLHARHADDYNSPGGDVFNSSWEDRGVLAHLTHAIGNGLLSAAWQTDDVRDAGRPRNNSRVVRFYYPFETSHRLTTTYELPALGEFRQVAFTGFVGTYRQRTDQDRFATTTAGRSLERADVDAKDFHVRGSAQRLVGSARVEFGGDVNGRYGLEAVDVVQTFDLSGAIASDTSSHSVEDARRVNSGGYIQAETRVSPSMHVSGGIRGDRVATKNVGGYFGNRGTSNQAVSGFGALTLRPYAQLSVTGQVSRGFRDPVLSDRYFRGPSGRGFITGNPDLKPERSLQFDLAARYEFRRIELAVYLYHYRIDDLVERYQTQTDFFFFRNRGRARLRGIEVEARSNLGRGYSVEAAGNIARGRALDDRAYLDDMPPDLFSVLGRKDFGNRLYAHARLALYGEDARPGPSEVAAPGATLLDAGAGWQIHPQLELRGAVRNVLNDSFYASPDPRWVWAPGRSASLTAVVEF